MNLLYRKSDEQGTAYYVEVNSDFESLHEEEAVWMLWAFAPLANVETFTEPESPERERLNAIVSKIQNELELRNAAVYAGMRLLDNWAELYFYALTSKGAEGYFRDVFREQGYTQIEFGATRDADAQFYHQNLAPDIYELQQAKNQQIIDELNSAGDRLASPRPVEHYLFFQTVSAMHRAAEALAAVGRVQTDLEEEGDYAHGLMCEPVHACTPEALEPITRRMIDTATAEHGIYLGWNTAMVQ